MDKDTQPFFVPMSVAVRLDDLERAAHADIITEQQAQALWSRWVAGPGRLVESTVPMPLADTPEASSGWRSRVVAMLARLPVVGARLRRWVSRP